MRCVAVQPRQRAAVSLIIGLLLATSCVGTPEISDWTTYRCENDELLLARFEPGMVEVRFRGDSATLEQDVSASGFVYRSGDLTLRGKGSDISWTGDGFSISCVSD